MRRLRGALLARAPLARRPRPPTVDPPRIGIQALAEQRHDLGLFSGVVSAGGVSCSSATSTSAPAMEPSRYASMTPGGRSCRAPRPACCRASPAGWPGSPRSRRFVARHPLVVAGLRGPAGPGRPGPSPAQVRKSLAVKSRAGDLAQVGVDVVGGDRRWTRRPSSTYWNSSWPGSSWQRRTIVARRRSRRPTSCCCPDLPRNRNRTRSRPAAGVAVRERGQAERAVEPGVLVVADADEGQLEQPDDGGQHLLARQPRACAGRASHALADAGQRPRERDQPIELVVVAPAAPRAW